MIKLGLAAAFMLLVTGVGWQVQRWHAQNFISKPGCDRRVSDTAKTIQKTHKDATDEKKRMADEAASAADKVPLAVPADIDRLCQRAASCRDRQG